MNNKPYIVIMPEAVGDAVCAAAPLNKLLDWCLSKNDVFVICASSLLDVFNDLKGVKKAYVYDEIPADFFLVSFEWIIDLFSISKTYNLVSKFSSTNYIHRSIDSTQLIEVKKEGKSFSFSAPIFNPQGELRESNPNEPAWALEAPLIAHVIEEDFWKWVDEGLVPKLRFKTDFIFDNDITDYKDSIILLPCGSSNVKRWPINNWVEIIDWFQNKEYNVNVFIGPDESDIYPIFKNLTGITLHQSVNLRGLAELVNFSKLVLANDCGPMHLAASQNIPVISIFGPTNPECWFCYKGIKKIYLQNEKAKEKLNSWGILDIDKKWEHWVNVDEVLLKVEEILAI